MIGQRPRRVPWRALLIAFLTTWLGFGALIGLLGGFHAPPAVITAATIGYPVTWIIVASVVLLTPRRRR